MMMDLFNDAPSYGSEQETYSKKKENVKLERTLHGDDIKQLISKKVLDPYELNTERTAGGINNNPFDMIIGLKRTQELCGLEIKGDNDTFNRLKTQLDAYTFCFEEVYLVLHKKEAPKWLPNFCGIMRIFADGTIRIEKRAFIQDVFDISSGWDWDSISYMNNIDLKGESFRKAMKTVAQIRKNVLYNRMFAQQKWGEHKYIDGTWIPLSDYQKELVMGFNIPWQMKQMNKEIKAFEKKLELVKSAMGLGHQEKLN